MTEVIIITLLHCLIVTFIHSSYFQLLIHKSNLQSCLCQYVKDPSPVKGVVENIGVEPMTSCMPCKRSSQLS